MKSKLILLLILIFSFSLRIYGLNWDQNQHLHPDERFLTMVLTSIKVPESILDYLNPSVSTLNPYNNGYGFFVYGTFPLYLTKIIGNIIYYDQYSQINLLGRILSAIFDTGIVFLLYLISKKLFNPRIGLLSAFVYSVMVLPIQLSHFFTVDPFLNFFIFLSFYFLVLFIKTKKNFLFSTLIGLVLGLALASKVSALYFLPIIGLGYIYKFFTSDKKNIIFCSLIFILTTYVSFRFNQPQAFFSANFLDFSLNPQFVSNLKTLSYYNRTDVIYPPGIQWLKTTPIIFPLINLVGWGLGLPLALLFLVSLVFIVYKLFLKIKQKKINKVWFINFIAIVWTLGLFIYQGSQNVKTMRYFLPIYPFIAFITGQFVYYLVFIKYKILKSKIILFTLYLLVVIYPLSFLSIYSHDITRITASKWIYQNIPSGSTIATEHWDDALPLLLDSYTNNTYKNLSLALFDPDTPQKWKEIDHQLENSDYIVLSSNRLSGSIPKNPDIYPETSKYYKFLFDGSLGFIRVAEFTSHPCFNIFGKNLFCFNDDNAEEAFTVYDHPKVIIFKNVSAVKN